MKIIKTFENFGKTQPLTYIKQPVEIRIDVEKVTHASIRQYRHMSSGSTSNVISNDEIIETIELAIEQITIDLMHNVFDIVQEEDGYPCPDVKAGQPYRFVIKNITNNLNVICQLEPGDNEFVLTVITVMTKPDFKTYPGQYIVEVES